MSVFVRFVRAFVSAIVKDHYRHADIRSHADTYTLLSCDAFTQQLHLNIPL